MAERNPLSRPQQLRERALAAAFLWADNQVTSQTLSPTADSIVEVAKTFESYIRGSDG